MEADDGGGGCVGGSSGVERWPDRRMEVCLRGCARRARGAIGWEGMAGMREVLQCCSDVQVGEDGAQVGERCSVHGAGIANTDRLILIEIAGNLYTVYATRRVTRHGSRPTQIRDRGRLERRGVDRVRGDDNT